MMLKERDIAVDDGAEVTRLDDATFQRRAGCQMNRRHNARPEVVQKARSPKRVFSA
jgi:hypothetical protein